MVDFHCNKCNVTHSNARDCPQYDGLPNYSSWGKDERRIARDFNRRAKLPENNYKPQRKGESAPKSGCVVVGAALLGTLVAVAKIISEVMA